MIAHRILGHRLNSDTMMWEREGMTSIPAEVMEEIQHPYASGIDLLYVLTWRDRVTRDRKAGVA